MKNAALAAGSIIILVIFGVIPFAFGPVRIYEKDSGRTVYLKCGQKLDIILNGNPTTGYNWETASLDRNVIRQNGVSEFKPATKAIGSPGTLTMHYIVSGKGSANLKLIYRRPWEKNVPPVKSFQVRVVVK